MRFPTRGTSSPFFVSVRVRAASACCCFARFSIRSRLIFSAWSWISLATSSGWLSSVGWVAYCWWSEDRATPKREGKLCIVEPVVFRLVGRCIDIDGGCRYCDVLASGVSEVEAKTVSCERRVTLVSVDNRCTGSVAIVVERAGSDMRAVEDDDADACRSRNDVSGLSSTASGSSKTALPVIWESSSSSGSSADIRSTLAGGEGGGGPK